MTDGLPALALSVDPYDEDIMERAPRDPNEYIITKRLVISIFSRGIMITLIGLSLFYFALMTYAPNWQTIGKYSPELYKPRTFVFCGLILSELLNVYNCRSQRHSVFHMGVRSNLWLLGAVILSFALNLVLIYTPLADLFQLSPLTIIDWLIIIPVGLLTIVTEELIKLYYRKYVYPKEEQTLFNL